MRTTLVIAAAATALALAGCSSSGGKQAKVTAAPKASVTTTTHSNAIGLHTNADEQAESQPDKPLTAAQRQALVGATRRGARRRRAVPDRRRREEGGTRPGRTVHARARARTTCRSPVRSAA